MHCTLNFHAGALHCTLPASNSKSMVAGASTLEKSRKKVKLMMVFFVLACQCMSTLAVVKRESKSWGWPVFLFVYMTTLAYIASLIVFQVGSYFGWGGG